MANKPMNRGYRVWIRAEESVYICQFQIYVGKIGDIRERDLGARVDHNSTGDIVG